MSPELQHHILEGFAGHRDRLLARARQEAKGAKARFVVISFWNMGSRDHVVYNIQEDRLVELIVTVAVPVLCRTGGEGYVQVDRRIVLPKELPGNGPQRNADATADGADDADVE